MLASELLELARGSLDDLVQDYLHSDAQIYFAMAQAQTELAITTECMRGDIPLVGKDVVQVPENVYHPQCILYNNKAYDIYPDRAPITTVSGNPKAFYHADDVIEIYPAQTVDVNFNLRAILVPKVDPSEDNDNLEIQSKYHKFLLPGTVYYAIKRLDADIKEYRKIQEWKVHWEDARFQAYKLTALRVRRQGVVKYGGY